MLFKNSKASIEQTMWHTYHRANSSLQPTGLDVAYTPPTATLKWKTFMQMQTRQHYLLIRNYASNQSMAWFAWKIQKLKTSNGITAALPFAHTHSVTCRVANISPRSNLTRNSNEIKCHQCSFSPFLLIVLGNGIRGCRVTTASKYYLFPPSVQEVSATPQMWTYMKIRQWVLCGRHHCKTSVNIFTDTFYTRFAQQL